MTDTIRYGLIGCGGFGRFCVEQYRTLPGLDCALVADADPGRAASFAAEWGMEACASPEALLAREDVDIVHIATPPASHGSLALAAMLQGKHVLCEKPLCLTMQETERLLAARESRGRVLAVDMMMRYNPLCIAVRALIESRLLGDPIHAHFVNDARDGILPPHHWFWDPAQSGGIFIEHGVHFFDLFDWWFGEGRILSAQEVARPGTSFIDQVNCTALYRGNVLVNFYHGFHQANSRDHQEWMLVFENGTLKMQEWVPSFAEIDFVGTEREAGDILLLFENGSVSLKEEFSGDQRRFSSRHKMREADGRYVLSLPGGAPKRTLYGAMVRDLMQDQLRVIRDPSHRPATNHVNAVSAVACAVEAQRLASTLTSNLFKS